jgi:glycosyltransferase involved in cell wall biosynthesis
MSKSHDLRSLENKIQHIIRQVRIKFGITLLGKLGDPFSLVSVPVPDIKPQTNSITPKFMLAITAVIRNEAANILEWVDFHLLAGVDHIYLYDNGSTDNTYEILQEFVLSGKVTISPWPTAFHHATQIFAYTHSAVLHRSEVEWMAFIDADEFLFPTQALDLKDVLASLKGFSALYIPWRSFGPSGHVTPPKTGVIWSYTAMADLDKADPGMRGELTKYKTIARLRDVTSIKIHTTLTNGKTLLDPEVIYLNHYITKSEIEFVNKLENHQLEQTLKNNPWKIIRIRMFQFLSLNTKIDTKIQEFLQRKN